MMGTNSREGSFCSTPKRYMERQGEGNAKASFWGDKQDRDDVMTQSKAKTEYITKLTSLRDSLINQEEVNLAQALDRLRLHTLSNKTHSKRLRSRAIDEFLSAPPLIHQRKNMVTTVERFKQMRPSRHQPVIFPLQGRQMLDTSSPRPASEEPISNFGNATNRSTRSLHPDAFGAKSFNAKGSYDMEETVQSNLQRLIQRTSSIPNIGRKAILKNQDGLEPKAKPLLNIRASLQKVQGHHLASPFLLSTHEDSDRDAAQGRSSGEWGGGVETMSPHARKLSPVLHNDAIDMDKLSQYYQKLICEMAPEIDAEDEEMYGNGDQKRKAGANYAAVGDGRNGNGVKFFQYKPKYRHTPYKSSLSKGSSSTGPDPFRKQHFNSYNSIVSSAGKTIPFSELPNITHKTTYTYYADVSTTDDVASEKNAKPQSLRVFPEVQTAYRFQMGSGVSDIGSTSSDISKWYGNKSLNLDKHTTENDSTNFVAKDGKMKIVVDMPNIIFNAASPDVGCDSASVVDPNERNSASLLKKTVKQHELRQRELQNLLEDVKELNSWSEIAAKRSIIPEGS